MKKMMLVVFLLFLVVLVGCGTTPAPVEEASKDAPIAIAKTPKTLVSPKPIPALPWWGDPNYPIIHTSRPMDPLQIMAFGLRPAVLTEEWTVLNWFEKQGGFHLDTLPIGTIVLVDQSGRVQYKYDCSNRLVQPTAGFSGWPATSAILPTTGPTTALPTTMFRRIDNWLSRLFRRASSLLQ